MNDLTLHLNKLHTTQLGEERIRRNLNLQANDVVWWCKEAVMRTSSIIKKGKNWYVYWDGAVITVNAHSYTIITAHIISANFRIMREEDYECLPEFLYHAIFIPKGTEPPPRSIISAPEILIYIQDFGSGPGDLGVVAAQNGQIIGAAWTRIVPAYGHIDNQTPELAVSILPELRGRGLGTRLIKKLFEILQENGYRQTSLSVQKDNPAVRFYKRLGYEIIAKQSNHEDYIMLKKL